MAKSALAKNKHKNQCPLFIREPIPQFIYIESELFVYIHIASHKNKTGPAHGETISGLQWLFRNQ